MYIKKVICAAKKLSVKRTLEKSKNVSKTAWRLVNAHRNNKPTRNNNFMIKENDTVMQDPHKITEIFSNSFDLGDVISKSNNNIAVTILQTNTNRVGINMNFRDITVRELLNIVKNMKNTNSSGHDDIPLSIIKNNFDILANPLTYFYNKCVEENVFPEQLTLAKIIPVHKKGSTTDPSNYRPISVLPTIGKIFEKCINNRIVKHLEINDVLHDRQFGYRNNVGTKDAIDTLVNDTVEGLNNKFKVMGLFLDLSAAFIQ